MTDNLSIHGSSFPLARSSRRRRRIASGQVEVAQPDAPVSELRQQLSPPQVSPIPSHDASHHEPLELLHIRSSLEATQPLTWVFTGDSLRSSSDAETRSFVELFGDAVRHRLRRLLDVVVDTGINNGRMRNLLDTLDWRATRFEPDAVVITIAEDDLLDDNGDCESNLASIIETLRESDSNVVLNAPQGLLPIAGESFQSSSQIGTIRELAQLYGVPLLEYPVPSRNSATSANADRSILATRHALIATMLQDVFDMNQ